MQRPMFITAFTLLIGTAIFTLLIENDLVRPSSPNPASDSSSTNQNQDAGKNRTRTPSHAGELDSKTAPPAAASDQPKLDVPNKTTDREVVKNSSLSTLIPPKTTVRDEVNKNPHTTPRSLLTFSLQISEKMQLAMNSPTEAEALFLEFEDCVLNPAHAERTTIQAACLLNASRLATQHREALNARYQKLSSDADPKVSEIAELMQSPPIESH